LAGLAVASSEREGGPLRERNLRRCALAAAVVVSAIAARVGVYALPVQGLDPELAGLVGVMVAFKAIIAMAAAALLWWRLGEPIAPASFALGLAVVAVLAAAPVMIAQGTLLLVTSVAFHAALLAAALLALADSRALGHLGRQGRQGRGRG
jgi:hypothetical protein